tara:strand:- start:1089 stop:1265 length:177 start_codon:yes stop_codon:yes gene_type:complete
MGLMLSKDLWKILKENGMVIPPKTCKTTIVLKPNDAVRVIHESFVEASELIGIEAVER